MNSPITILHEAGEPLGLFFRPGRDDHNTLKQLLSENQVGMLGCVFDPCNCDRQDDLRHEILQRDLDAILDPGMMELASLGGHTPARQRLPWAMARPHVVDDFGKSYIDKVCEELAVFVAAKEFSSVLAPTHYLQEGPKDFWFGVDKRLVISLRQRLDANGCKNVAINYPLAIPTKVLLDSASRVRIKADFYGLPIQSVWLRIHPFGSYSGDTSLRRYILACREMHSLKLPLIAEKTGVLGLALLAFGAVTGVDSGVSSGEKFDFSRLKIDRQKKGGFRRPARVYVPDLGLFLTRSHAKQLFENRAFGQYACRDTECCRRGVETMLADSRRHFVYTRMGEIDDLSKAAPTMRPNLYLERILRPATDHIGRVLAHPDLPDELRTVLERSRVKQAGWRSTLGEMSVTRSTSISPIFERRVQRQQATA